MTPELAAADLSVPDHPCPCDSDTIVPTGTATARSLPPCLEEQLDEICRLVREGIQPPHRTVRCLLGWIGATRRTFAADDRLVNYFNAYGLKTIPDYLAAGVDDELAFASASESEGYPGRETSYQIGQLKAATSDLMAINVDGTLAQAVTLMMHSNYSQLPVVGNSKGRDVLGVISWRSIGKCLALNVSCGSLRDYMEPAQVISAEESFFSALEIIAKHDYVLVRGRDKKLTGILTASDFNDQFRELAEPFLLVGEIEKGLRSILAGHFSEQELQAARAPGAESRKITGISSLTFGEYVRLLDTDDAWKKIGLSIDRQRFICWLKEVGELRNKVMHFHANGLEMAHLSQLQKFAEFLRCLRATGAI